MLDSDSGRGGGGGGGGGEGEGLLGLTVYCATVGVGETLLDFSETDEGEVILEAGSRNPELETVATDGAVGDIDTE